MPADACVTAVYPSGDVLPENVLRFYVHFSAPMAPHRVWDFLRLRDARGVADNAAFMRFKQELWSADRTRLTVLMDPGRIKRGVGASIDNAPALVQGERYTLAVDGGWPAADGQSVLPPFSKPFRVGAPLRDRPSVLRWEWAAPAPGTREPLEVVFDRAFDRHLLPDAIRIGRSDGRAVAGTVHVGTAERSWSFTPHEGWPEDARLIVDGFLEDVAGNNFRDLLDTPIRSPHEAGKRPLDQVVVDGGA